MSRNKTKKNEGKGKRGRAKDAPIRACGPTGSHERADLPKWEKGRSE
jgi:hypothetical protein